MTRGTVWRDQTGQPHGVMPDQHTLETRHKGREITIAVEANHVRVRSTFPNGCTLERLIPIPIPPL